VRVETVNNRLLLELAEDGRITVDMNRPIFELDRLPFDAQGLTPRTEGGFELWPLALAEQRTVPVAVLSMGNPHAVLRVDDVVTAPVAELGPLIEGHARFPRKVNVGFMQVLSHSAIALRVYERDAGETLACGTGACAAVVAGIRLGWLDRRVDVHARGGLLTIEWPADDASVRMTGPAETVYQGEIEL
jgi:diaminopimelate epimerase